ncbi:dual oxidase 1-like [Ctenocephalides felis]|uniref:dual oxidase 1-like n=1 Tax=Ctenocephalides felis TaxID=7515 RepID=UPI000E6E34E0|nr:dual oxidase 1-like [Ctenocephalides felis]
MNTLFLYVPEVTLLKFKKPHDFTYKSGQWVRIACSELNANEFHPFTLSSSPNENHLSVHIRAVGPWTTNIRKVFDPAIPRVGGKPSIRLDGPYGEAHQDWHKCDVAILVGGGIGVTPFASILKDIVYKSNLQKENVKKKVYFLWVTRTQRQFEWLVDIIRELEQTDINETVVVHIFITQFYKKFDLRTILLYICETQFQKTAGRSLFTGLRAVTHFGRPDFYQFFKHIGQIHQSARNIGVFTCGPPHMSNSVESATRKMTERSNTDQLFSHHYTNF